ncbi:NUDIX hydrolase [Ectobacillus ponti]|uniref:NUDIX hydrolase n=1 Tax=Ectobacillus ponti TaxID=2961894 RepID=A0AA41XEW6_9BACI|nr:NUDIX hydrolase [Ectobacillus ponti]MCP8970831.1 NUDIX hydrolase [Ectobacillus ponti]
MAYMEEIRELVGTRPLIMVGSAVLVTNEQHEILLQLRSDTGDWGVPGGAMEPGETIEETAARELLEETGLSSRNLRFLGVLSGKEFYYRYPHGDEVYNVIHVFQTDRVQGELQTDDEGIALKYFPIDRLPKLNMTAENILRSFFVTLTE